MNSQFKPPRQACPTPAKEEPTLAGVMARLASIEEQLEAILDILGEEGTEDGDTQEYDPDE